MITRCLKKLPRLGHWFVRESIGVAERTRRETLTGLSTARSGTQGSLASSATLG